jgi:signal peptidase complex subunit 2
MAKKKQSKKTVVEDEPVVESEAEEEEEDDDEEEEEEEMELLQVDVGDMIKVKQILDETVAATVLEQIDEDYHFDNFKLLLMAIACAFAMVAQFAPLPFPESRIVIGVCCASYFVLSTVLQLITTIIDQDCILLTRPLPKDGKKDDPNDIDIIGRTIFRKSPKDIKNKDLFGYGVRVRSQFERFSEWYTVILEFEQKKDTPCVEQKWSVGQFFDTEGMFDEIGLQMEVEKLYRRLEDADYDVKSAAEKKKD